MCELILKGEVYHSYMEVLLGDGIFNVDGELWRKQRKTASFEFASKNLRDFSAVVFREYSLKLASILSQASCCNQQVDMQVRELNDCCCSRFYVKTNNLFVFCRSF